jgi:putative membrane protein
MNTPTAWALLFHILGFVLWMSGLLVVTQMLAAHSQEPAADARRVLERLEKKLLKAAAHPGAAVTVIAGIIVVSIQPAYLHQGWLHAKLFLVAILIGLDLMVTLRTREFHAGRIGLQPLEMKILHGLISLVFVGILVLVMIKPF